MPRQFSLLILASGTGLLPNCVTDCHLFLCLTFLTEHVIGVGQHATSRKVAASIPDEITGFLQFT
jgi:hypothetical protein